jgi:hypothetical protein
LGKVRAQGGWDALGIGEQTINAHPYKAKRSRLWLAQLSDEYYFIQLEYLESPAVL